MVWWNMVLPEDEVSTGLFRGNRQLACRLVAGRRGRPSAHEDRLSEQEDTREFFAGRREILAEIGRSRKK
jgi:hypothetical protein